jgi:hypothetical protein
LPGISKSVPIRSSVKDPSTLRRPESTSKIHKFLPLVQTQVPTRPPKMKTADLSQLATALAAPDFKAIEPHLIALDKHLILRTYVEGYSLSEADQNIWVTIRSNKVANAFLKRGALPNLARWFNYIEQSHPEIQEEIKAKDEAEKARKAGLSKAGANYNMALQDVEKGVVTRFPPEPSYVPFPKGEGFMLTKEGDTCTSVI